MILLSQRKRTVTRKRLTSSSLITSHFICLAFISEYFSNVVGNTASVALGRDRANFQFHHGRKFSGTHEILRLVTTVRVTPSLLPWESGRTSKMIFPSAVLKLVGVKVNHTNDYLFISGIHVLIILLFCSWYKCKNNIWYYFQPK